MQYIPLNTRSLPFIFMTPPEQLAQTRDTLLAGPKRILDVANNELAGSYHGGRSRLYDCLVKDIAFWDRHSKEGSCMRYAGVVLTEQQVRHPEFVPDQHENWVEYLQSHQGGIVPFVRVSTDEEPKAPEWYDQMREAGVQGIETHASLNMNDYSAEKRAKGAEGEGVARISMPVMRRLSTLISVAQNSQKAGLFPIVGPNLHYKGFFSAADHRKVSSQILSLLNEEFDRFKVDPALLGMQMTIPMHGTENEATVSNRTIAYGTAQMIRECLAEETQVACLNGDVHSILDEQEHITSSKKHERKVFALTDYDWSYLDLIETLAQKSDSESSDES